MPRRLRSSNRGGAFVAAYTVASGLTATRAATSRRSDVPVAPLLRWQFGPQPWTEERRSPCLYLAGTRSMFVFLLIVPLRNPRTECANQPVAFISSFSEAPSGRLSRPRTLAALLPSRAINNRAVRWTPVGRWSGPLRSFPVGSCRRDRNTRSRRSESLLSDHPQSINAWLCCMPLFVLDF